MGRVWFEVARRSFRRATTYRTATAAGVFVNTVFGYLRASVLVYVATAGGGAVNGMTGTELATFSFVTQGFLMVVGAFGEPELAERIRTGDVVVDLYRPIDLQAWWSAVWLGNAGYQVLARGLPPVALGAIAFDLRWPDPWWHWIPFVVSVLLASLAGFALRFLANLTTFWLLDNRGIDQMVTLLTSFFGGLLLPLDLFPGWLEATARLLPFAAMIQLPSELFLGMHGARSVLGVLATQAAWVLVLLAAGRLLLAAATRKLVVQGG